jgi:hypothetical protein
MVLSSTYQSTDNPLLSTLYEPLSKHLITVLGHIRFREKSRAHKACDAYLCSGCPAPTMLPSAAP